MTIFESLNSSLTSPMVLSFVLGVAATLIRSDLKFPDGMYLGLTIYLLFAIGLKGGMKLSQTDFSEFVMPGMGAIIMCTIIPVWSFLALHKLARFDAINAAALSAHFGSVSVVTFSQCLTYLESLNMTFEGFMPAILAIMEVPAVLIALFIASRYTSTDKDSNRQVIRELLTGKSSILLIGGIVIGYVGGTSGFAHVAPLFDSPFKGIVCLFLLEVGLVAGRRIGDLGKAGIKLIVFSLCIPIVNAFAGAWVAHATGLSVGGAVLFSVLCASASYIAAPAAVRIALPAANPGYYLTASLAITFPFNVTVGIPLYMQFVQFMYK
jgi:hypothetical protein